MIWNRDAETMPRARLEQLQVERLRQSVGWAAERVPFYRDRLASSGVKADAIHGLADLAQIPFTVKDHLREHYPFGLFAVPVAEVARIHASSGTRGKPTVVGYTRKDLALWREVMARSLAAAGAEPGDLIQVAYGLSFTVLLFHAFVATIPRELDEAAIIDGAGPIRLFFQIILPLLKPVVVTVVVVQSVAIFNDFTFPLYYLPGSENVTVQLTLYNFQSQFNTQFNLLFTNILLITIPPLIVFLFFNKQIVAGLTAGAVKG